MAFAGKRLLYSLSVLALFVVSDCYRVDEEREDAGARVAHMLRVHNLPQELIPVSLVTEFDINKGEGNFRIKLEKSCYATIDQEYLWYGEEIKGRVMSGRMEDVSGIQSKMLLVWLPVKQVHVDDAESGYVYLEVGPSYKKLSASAFQSPLPCSGDRGLYSLF